MVVCRLAQPVAVRRSDREEMERSGNGRLNLRHLSQVSQKSQHTHFEEIILDQNRSRGTRTTTTGVSLVVCTIMHTESEIYNHAYWSCEILMVVCQKIWHGDAVLYYIACCPVCCVVLCCVSNPLSVVLCLKVFLTWRPPSFLCCRHYIVCCPVCCVVLNALYCVLPCLLCCIVCIILCVLTCFTTLLFVVSAPVVSATICQNVTILPGKQRSQRTIVCWHNTPSHT